MRSASTRLPSVTGHRPQNRSAIRTSSPTTTCWAPSTPAANRRFWGPYIERDDFHEPFVLFGYLAGVTSSIEFETGIIVLPQRQAPSGGQAGCPSRPACRVGDSVLASARAGTTSSTSRSAPTGEQRGAVLDDQIVVIRSLWDNDVIDYTSDLSSHRSSRNPSSPAAPHSDLVRWVYPGGAAAGGALGRRLHLRRQRAGAPSPSSRAVASNCSTTAGAIPRTSRSRPRPTTALASTPALTRVAEARDAGFSHFAVNCQSTTCGWSGSPAADLQQSRRAHRRARGVHRVGHLNPALLAESTYALCVEAATRHRRRAWARTILLRCAGRKRMRGSVLDRELKTPWLNDLQLHGLGDRFRPFER